MRLSKALFVISFWLCVSMHAQNKQLLYDFTEIPQSLMINPGAQVDFKWYAGVPTVSGLSFQAGSSGISAFDLFANDGLDINDKLRDRVLNGMTARDELSGTYQLELLNVGFRGKDPNMFYSFGIYNEGDAIGYWFEDYAILAIDGNADQLSKRFDLGDLKTRGEMVNVFHFGANKIVNRKLRVGARAKIYSSIFDFNSTRNKGFYVTRPGQNNLLSSTFNADMQWRTSGINAIKDGNSEETLGNTIFKRGFFGGNLGLGVDLGFTYKINDQTTFTGSLLDLGLIYHSNDVENYTLKGDITTEGVEVILPDALTNPNRDFWQDLVDDIEEVIPFENNFDSYVTFRPTKLNASLRYNWGEQSLRAADCDCGPNASGSNRAPKYLNGIGGQIYMINRPRGPQTALTAFYIRRFGNIMALKATYTVDKFSYTNVGLGINLQAGPVNLYFLADNLLAYQNLIDSQYLSFQLGLNIISWGKK
jgi:hypothetical protein